MPRIQWTMCVVWAGISILELKAYSAPREVPGQSIIRLEDGHDASAVQKELSRSGLVLEEVVPSLGLYRVRYPLTRSRSSIHSVLRKAPGIRSVHPDVIGEPREKVPNDLDFPAQWHLQDPIGGIGAISAWELGTGGLMPSGEDVVVAVVDAGLYTAHPDIAASLWTNDLEVPKDGIDNDGNGYIDDMNGFNFSDHTGILSGDLHGTHVTGILGAAGNNRFGIAGVNWKVKILFLQVGFAISEVFEAYNYVVKLKEEYLASHGARGANVVVVNSSFGYDGQSCTSEQYGPFDELFDKLGKLGILSAAATANSNYDIEVVGDVPTGCSSPYLISVTSTTIENARANGAAFGAKQVDLGAPGINILSIRDDKRTRVMSGTSMASPQVAGAVALLWSVASKELEALYEEDPARGALALKEILLGTAHRTGPLLGETLSGGRLDLAAAALEAGAFGNDQPMLELADYDLSGDRFIRPGKAEELVLKLRNAGRGRFKGGTFELSSAASGVVISPAQISLSSIEGGGKVIRTPPVSVTINGTFGDRALIPFRVAIATKGKGVVARSFSLEVKLASQGKESGVPSNN